MKILKKLMILLVLAALIIGCSKEPENNYLGNLKVGYTMKLDDKEVPKAKFEFFYGRALTKYLNQYYSAFSDDYASIVDFNIEKDINDLKNQDCTVTGYTDKSWEYYFADQAKKDILEVEALVRGAKTAGYQINADDKKKARSTFGELESYCKENKIDFEDYLHSTFGLEATKDNLISYYEEANLASRYAAVLLKEPTDEEVEQYYLANKNDIDTINIRYFAFAKDDKAKADEFAQKIRSEADFKQMAVDYSSDDKKIYYQNNDLSLRQDLRKSDLPEYLQSVLFDQALPINSVRVVEGDSSIDVVMLVAREQPVYRQASISTVYLDARETDTDNLTTEKMNTCKEFADNLLQDFMNNTDRSIDKFHEYNSKYADDKNNQGDYDNISKGDSTIEIANWVFDESRQVGDLEVLMSNYGYTIVYFRGFGGIDYFERAKVLAKEATYDKQLNDLKRNIKVMIK